MKKIKLFLTSFTKKQIKIFIVGTLIICLGIGITILNKKNTVHADGWEKAPSGETYYYKDNQKLVGWQMIHNYKCYFNEKGVLQTGFVTIDTDTYYFDHKGIMQTGWQEIDGKIYCLCDEGALLTGEKEIDGTVYTFNEEGVIELKEDESSISLKEDENGNTVIEIIKTDGSVQENVISSDSSINQTPPTTIVENTPNNNSTSNNNPSSSETPVVKPDEPANDTNSSSNSGSNSEVTPSPTPTPEPTPQPSPEPTPEPAPEPVVPTFSVTPSEVYQYALNIGVSTYGLEHVPSMNLYNAGWNAPYYIYADYSKEKVYQDILAYWEADLSMNGEWEYFNIVVTEEASTHGHPVICVYWCY